MYDPKHYQPVQWYVYSGLIYLVAYESLKTKERPAGDSKKWLRSGFLLVAVAYESFHCWA